MIALKRDLHSAVVRLRRAERSLADSIRARDVEAVGSDARRTYSDMVAARWQQVRTARVAADAAKWALHLAMGRATVRETQALSAQWIAEHIARTGRDPADCDAESCPFGKE